MNKKLLAVLKKRYEFYTQKQIASMCEMPESDVSLIWTGKRRLTIETFEKLCGGTSLEAWEVWHEAMKEAEK